MSSNVGMPWCDEARRDHYGRCVKCGFRSAARSEAATPRHRMRAWPCDMAGEGHRCARPLSGLHQHQCDCGATLSGLAIRGVGWSHGHALAATSPTPPPDDREAGA